MSSVEMPSRSRDEEDQEESSSLLLNQQKQVKSSSPRATDGKLYQHPPSSSTFVGRDLRICNTAWNRLSCPTRSALLIVMAVVLIFATYEFGVDEGVREQEHVTYGNDKDESHWTSVFGGDDETKGADADSGNQPKPSSANTDKKQTNPYSIGNTAKTTHHAPGQDKPPTPQPTEIQSTLDSFTRDTLNAARSRAMALLYELKEYYGGEDQVRNMLVKSWQTGWMLEEDEYRSYENDAEEQSDDDDDDDSVELRHLGKRSERKKKRKKKKGNADDDDDNSNANDDDDNTDDDAADSNINEDAKKDEDKKKKPKKKGAKEGKILVNPDTMSQEELSKHHHRRRQRTHKLVSTMARAILNPHQRMFKIGTIGSSVAAGHDNCDYDSYENQLERTLTPIMAAANMMTQVQNAGEGGGCGDSHQNQVFCITHNVSPDVDIIHYSWTYFEKVNPEVQREQLIRWAQHMERRPMVHHLVARGKKNTCMGDDSPTVELGKQYAEYGYNSFCIQTGLYAGGHDYDTEAENGLNRFGWQQHGDGYHNTTRYGEELEDDDPRKTSLGTVYRNWHPGPLGFQIASDAFAYVYVSGLMMALNIIEEDMNDGLDLLERWFDADERRRMIGTVDEEDKENLGHSPVRQLRAVSSKPSSSIELLPRHLHGLPPLGVMPEPLFCDPIYCSIPNPPNCLNYEKPTFGPPGIAVKEQSQWTVSVDDNGWNHMVGKVDIAIIKAKHDPEWERKCTHADACGGISAQDPTNGVLTYELPSEKMTAGLVIVCGCCGKNVGSTMFIENQNVIIKLNGRVLDKQTMDVYPNAKCVRLLKRFGEIDGYQKEDSMLLSFEISKQDSDESASEVKISHVIAL